MILPRQPLFRLDFRLLRAGKGLAEWEEEAREEKARDAFPPPGREKSFAFDFLIPHPFPLKVLWLLLMLPGLPP